MKNKLYTILAIFTFLLMISENFAQSEPNQINYQLSITHPSTNNSLTITSGIIKEGSYFTFPKYDFSNTEFEVFQNFYNAIEESRFGFKENATNNDIDISIDIRYLDEETGSFQPIGRLNDNVFIYFEVNVLDLKTDEYFSGDDSYYFNSDDAAYFMIPKSKSFFDYLFHAGFPESTSQLKFGYIVNDLWDTRDIITVDNDNYFGFKAAHFSRFGGGRGNTVDGTEYYSRFGGGRGNSAEGTPSIDSYAQNGIPSEFFLSQNFPNPFNPTTKIKFGIADESEVQLKVYNILGIEVATLVDDYLTNGYYEIHFDATDYPSGIYFYELNNGSSTIIKKMTLVR